MLRKGQEYKDACRRAYEPSKDWENNVFACNYGLYKKRVENGGNPDILFIVKGHKVVAGEVFDIAKFEKKKEKEQPVLTEIEDFDEYLAKKYINLKLSAKKRGKEFNLSLADVKKLCKRKTCYYTGIKLGYYKGGEEVHPNMRTVDRIDPDKGYIKGNVVACSHLANQFKAKIERDFIDFMPRSKVLLILNKMFSDGEVNL